jgi:hypothetical protein
VPGGVELVTGAEVAGVGVGEAVRAGLADGEGDLDDGVADGVGVGVSGATGTWVALLVGCGFTTEDPVESGRTST